MAISERRSNDGTRYSVEVVKTIAGKRRRKTVGTFSRKRDAQKAERVAKVQIENGSFEWDGPARAVPLVSDAVSQWLDTKAMQVTSNSLNGYQIAATNYVVPAWGKLPVDEVTYSLVQQQVNAWVKDGKGAQTVNRAILVLRGALDFQMRAGTVKANAASGVVKPSASQSKEITIWNDVELSQFLARARSHYLAPLWFMLSLEGMRRSEALAIRWSDIRWEGERAIATIQRTLVPDLQRGGAAMLQERTKTRGSRRSILLTRETSDLLRAHRDRQQFLKREIGDDWLVGDAIVTTTVGTLVNPTSVKHQLNKLIRDCDLPDITTHTLRHMAATKMLQGGAPLQVVQARLGHADVRMTADRYGHLEVMDQLAATEAVERALQRGAKGNQ